MGAISQSGKRFRAKAMKAQKVHISLLPLATLVAPILGQLQFNGGVSSSSNSNSNSANRNTNRPTSGDVDEKFFLGGDTPSLTGNQALDGGIVGLGLGALGAAVLGPTIQGALNGGQQSQGFNSCGRRKRQANFGPGATPPAGATTAETCRARRDIQTTPGPTRLAATKDDEECEECHYLKLLTCEIHHICGYICQD